MYHLGKGSSEEVALVAIPSKKKVLKSGTLKTANFLVLHNIIWLHEMVHRAEEQLAVHDHISISLFISSYMQVMEAEKQAFRPLIANHIVELMGDAELYDWELVCAFPIVWLQQQEHSQVILADETTKLKFRGVLI